MSLFRRWLMRRAGRLEQVKDFMDSTGDRYLDPPTWARLRGISEEVADFQLKAGVTLGFLEPCLLYEWNDSPAPFVVPLNALGRSIRLADIGYIGEDDEDEILISENRVRNVYVAATNEQ